MFVYYIQIDVLLVQGIHQMAATFKLLETVTIKLQWHRCAVWIPEKIEMNFMPVRQSNNRN